MKRIFLISVIISLLSAIIPAFCQTDTAATIAAKEDSEERYKRMNAAIEELQAGHAALRKRVLELEETVQKLNDELARVTNGLATKADLALLADKLVELDKSREADKKLILEQLSKLGASLKNFHSTPPSNNISSTAADKGYEYIIQSGDTLSKIVKAYNDAGIKVTLKQIQDANPGINPNALKVGQKIFIPAPSGK
ncbi:MAG TPA: LysM peptidoglycan-binding domain-containing protein [Verrucomicrobiota bacterium]|nr:LysM peptidoglycan-binding domain-containing protein [Verrucomicrobiota bacterium]